MINKDPRLGWDEYFLTITDVISERSTCDRGKVGCVIVKDNRLLTTGYAGSAPQTSHCDESGHLMIKKSKKIFQHDSILSIFSNNNKSCNNKKYTLREYMEAISRYLTEQFSDHCIRTIHAEVNAIAQAAKYGIPIIGATLYCSLEPCFDCAKLIVASGINRVVCKNPYHSSEHTHQLFAEVGIDLQVFNQEELK